MSKPHSIVGIPEARKILRLIDGTGPASLAELNSMAAQAGAATPADDAATVIRRMRKIADDAIRLHGAHELTGRRVRLTRPQEVYPTGIFEAGLTGTVASVQPDLIAVKLDRYREELDEWRNELHWYRDDLEPGRDLVEEFLTHIELI